MLVKTLILLRSSASHAAACNFMGQFAAGFISQECIEVITTQVTRQRSWIAESV